MFTENQKVRVSMSILEGEPEDTPYKFWAGETVKIHHIFENYYLDKRGYMVITLDHDYAHVFFEDELEEIDNG